MTAQPYNRFVYVPWSCHLTCNGNQALGKPGLSNYARSLLYCDLQRIVIESFAVTDMTTVAGVVLFRSESKGNVFHASERP